MSEADDDAPSQEVLRFLMQRRESKKKKADLHRKENMRKKRYEAKVVAMMALLQNKGSNSDVKRVPTTTQAKSKTKTITKKKKQKTLTKPKRIYPAFINKMYVDLAFFSFSFSFILIVSFWGYHSFIPQPT
jgi:hypothetical protein